MYYDINTKKKKKKTFLLITNLFFFNWKTFSNYLIFDE